MRPWKTLIQTFATGMHIIQFPDSGRSMYSDILTPFHVGMCANHHINLFLIHPVKLLVLIFQVC